MESKGRWSKYGTPTGVGVENSRVRVLLPLAVHISVPIGTGALHINTTRYSWYLSSRAHLLVLESPLTHKRSLRLYVAVRMGHSSLPSQC